MGQASRRACKEEGRRWGQRGSVRTGPEAAARQGGAMAAGSACLGEEAARRQWLDNEGRTDEVVQQRLLGKAELAAVVRRGEEGPWRRCLLGDEGRHQRGGGPAADPDPELLHCAGGGYGHLQKRRLQQVSPSVAKLAGKIQFPAGVAFRFRSLNFIANKAGLLRPVPSVASPTATTTEAPFGLPNFAAAVTKIAHVEDINPSDKQHWASFRGRRTNNWTSHSAVGGIPPVGPVKAQIQRPRAADKVNPLA
uniref:Uncharacterized protein n=1 Tax=Oryza glumipatula TaxID=40148 RepID=A0A0E0BGP6_9ORYZ